MALMSVHYIYLSQDLSLPQLSCIPVCVCVYYCRTYYKAVRVGGGG